MFTSPLYQKLRVIQFYKILSGNNWEFEMLDRKIAEISRMINVRNMRFSEDVSNIKISKVAKFVFHSTYDFRAIKIFPSRGQKMTPAPVFIGFKKKFKNLYSFIPFSTKSNVNTFIQNLVKCQKKLL